MSLVENPNHDPLSLSLALANEARRHGRPAPPLSASQTHRLPPCRIPPPPHRTRPPRLHPLPSLCHHRRLPLPHVPRSSNPNLSQSLTSQDLPVIGGSGDIPPCSGVGGGWGSDGAPSDHHHEEGPSSDRSTGGPLGLFLEGWRSRVSADPQFPFKILMEELVGVTTCVLGDMASRPNFGLNELDFVFSTMVVGSIFVNFVLTYLLTPTAATAAAF